MAEFVRSGGIEGSVNTVFGGYRYYRVRHVIGTHFLLALVALSLNPKIYMSA